MTRSRFGLMLGFAMFASLGAQTAVRAQVLGAPSVYAHVPSYQHSNPAQPGQDKYCNNEPSSMPAGRQFSCGKPVLTRQSTGVYKIAISNGAPLPVAGTTFEDAGYAIFVAAVDSNAFCAETSTTWNNFPQGNFTLTSIFSCVTPTGVAVDTDFDWFYRTDSLSYPQQDGYEFNFAYARFNRGTPTQSVGAQTFNPFLGSFGAGPITAQKTSTGVYKVIFQKVNVPSSWGDLDTTYGLNNVIVQRTCANDSSASCKRAVCGVSGWSLGTTSTSDTTVDVRCYLGASPVDVDYRIFVGNQSHSGHSFQAGREWQYGWVNSPGFGAGNCLATDQFPHRNVHQLSVNEPATMSLSMCRNGTGVYTVNFASHGGFYKWDAVSAIVTPRSANVYCNAAQIRCGNDQCSIPPDPTVDVRCYNAANGSAVSALWNLSLTY